MCCGRCRRSACSVAAARCHRTPPRRVVLRGIGPSGVSRTLVMIDGIPFNDPLGLGLLDGVPLESVNHIEVIDGSSSSSTATTAWAA